MKYISTIPLATLLFLHTGYGSDSDSSDNNDTNIVDNSAQLKNEFGYYGDGVMFETEKVVGNWNGSNFRFFKFNKDGTKLFIGNGEGEITCISFEAGCCYKDSNSSVSYICKARAEYVR